jgi:hypothetical protein
LSIQLIHMLGRGALKPRDQGDSATCLGQRTAMPFARTSSASFEEYPADETKVSLKDIIAAFRTELD